MYFCAALDQKRAPCYREVGLTAWANHLQQVRIVVDECFSGSRSCSLRGLICLRPASAVMSSIPQMSSPHPCSSEKTVSNVFAVSISKKKTVDRPKRKNETAQSIFLIESCTAIVDIRGWCGHRDAKEPRSYHQT